MGVSKAHLVRFGAARLRVLFVARPDELASLGEPATDDVARVLHVFDGDTILVWRLGRREYVRLAGVDAPERGVVGGPAKRGYFEARKMLQGLVLGLLVRLEADPLQVGCDRFGRTIAYLRCEDDGLDVCEAMIRGGWCRAWRGGAFARHERFIELELEAVAAGVGRWSSIQEQLHDDFEGAS